MGGSQMGKQSDQGQSMYEAAKAELQKISKDPQEFIQHAYQNNLTEIQLGQLAQQKGQSQDIKQFGQQLAQNQQTLNDQITKLAADKNIQLSKQLDARHQKVLDHFQALAEGDFDKHFTGEQIMAHRRDVALYQSASQGNTDSDVKSFAQNSLPTLREQLQLAQKQATTINEAAGASRQEQGGATKENQQKQDQQQQQP